VPSSWARVPAWRMSRLHMTTGHIFGKALKCRSSSQRCFSPNIVVTSIACRDCCWRALKQCLTGQQQLAPFCQCIIIIASFALCTPSTLSRMLTHPCVPRALYRPTKSIDRNRHLPRCQSKQMTNDIIVLIIMLQPIAIEEMRYFDTASSIRINA